MSPTGTPTKPAPGGEGRHCGPNACEEEPTILRRQIAPLVIASCFKDAGSAPPGYQLGHIVIQLFQERGFCQIPA
jgi:hypothetical protein